MTTEQQDAIALYCGECDSREFGPTVTDLSGTNLHRNVRSMQDKVLATEKVTDHVRNHGPVTVLSCADLHEAGGVDLYSHDPAALVDKAKGGTPVCPYEVHLLGGFSVPEDFTAARVSLLLPHWHRGCRTMQTAMQRMEDDSEVRGGFGGRRNHDARCDLCEFHEDGLFSRHALLHGFYHTATEHKVGEAACSVVACRGCRQSTVVTHELGAPIGRPRECRCETAHLFWDRRLL